MEGNILDFTLNAPLSIFRLLILVAVWYILWNLIIKRILKRCNVTSFWYELYKLGAFGSLGLTIFLLIFVILFIASIQAVIEYGIKLLLPLFIFWGGIGTVAILIIKAILKKKD